MRFLIVAAAVLACAAAAPSGALLAPYAAHGYAHGPVAYAAPVAVAHAAHIAPALPTISSGDLQAAAIDAHVDASDHARAAVDAAREYHDQASELQGRAINAAEDHSWQAVDAVKTHEAQLDGAAAGVAPVLAKSLVGHVAPVAAYAAAPVVAHGGYAAAPAVYAGHTAYAGHVGYAGHAAYAGHVGYAGHAAYAAPALAASKSVVTQSLSQSHPAPVHSVYHAAPVYSHAPVLSHGYAAAPYGHAW